MVPVKLKGCFSIASASIPSIISFFAYPHLSYLVYQATVKSINLSEAPMTSAIPDNIFLF
jgi:hypothetical protein